MPQRAHGKRQYSSDDVTWAAFLIRLKETGMPVKQIARYAALRNQGEDTLAERYEMLTKHHQTVLAQKARLEHNIAQLERKLNLYREKME